MQPKIFLPNRNHRNGNPEGQKRQKMLMSDLHITDQGTVIFGVKPLERFKTCLNHTAKYQWN